MQVPTNYCPIAQNENVIASLPNMYIMTCLDKIKTILTLGLYYCFVLQPKQQFRSGFMVSQDTVLSQSINSHTG